jgi:Cu(I)/Ag(I) efflux system membrane fusion protein
MVAVGAVRYDEHDIALVQMRVAGYVTQLHVRAALDRVRRGQVLAEIASPVWTEAESEYLALLHSDSTSAAALRDAARHRLSVLGIPETSITELEKSGIMPATTSLLAPVDGVVTELGIRDGASFEAGAVLFRLNGTTTVWVDAQVPETAARMITPGTTVETRATAYPGEVFKGRVHTLLPQLDSTTRTLGARIAIDNRAGRLSPGMFVQSIFRSPPGPAQLWVPSEAIIVTGERGVVIVKHPDGAFAVANVTMGADADGRTAILSGLTEGETIVLSGQFLIDSEANLKSAVHRLTVTPHPDSGPAP